MFTALVCLTHAAMFQIDYVNFKYILQNFTAYIFALAKNTFGWCTLCTVNQGRISLHFDHYQI